LPVTTLLAAAAISGLALAPAGAGAAPVKSATTAAYHVTRPSLPAGEHYACNAPTYPGEMTCDAIYMTGGIAAPAAITKPGAAVAAPYNPSDLRSAYDLARAARSQGRGVVVAIVDAYRDPNAGNDLSVYRKHFGLPACTRKNKCLKIVNQNGRAHLPGANANWAGEESLDLDMISAICPHCHILLVEANNSGTRAMGTAERTAARRAHFVSNSWSGANFRGEQRFNRDFNHPGHVIDFAAGDFGFGYRDHNFPYNVAYPTGLPFVTAVGGTSLVNTPSRGRKWTETVWGSKTDSDGGTNSGCTGFARPSWQKAVTRKLRHCRNRVENDVSANANPATGVAVYDSYQQVGWVQYGGTSEATPIITAMWALAGRPGAHAYPVSYLYRHVRDFYDVRSGTNGSCSVKWLCHAERGFDGPTGLGTPRGIGGLRK
jgi:subtilase family serine protease